MNLPAERRSGLIRRSLPWIGIVLPIFMLGGLYHQSIVYMVEIWIRDENYGHAFFIPLISLYLIWERRHALRAAEFRGSWWGIAWVLAGIGLYAVGELSTLYGILHLSLWVVLIGLLITAMGIPGVRAMAFPLFYLFMMIPLPDFIYQGLSGRLQLISSMVGVGFLQTVGIMVFREGNVIDLGTIQLQVVEACSGIRFLFPLTALSLLCAYLFNDTLWKRILLVFSSLPVAVLLNGFRIGVTGVLVDLYGRGPAEGFFHSFSGWLFFTTGILVFLAEMWFLSRMTGGKKRRSFGDIFSWPRFQGGERQPQEFSGAFVFPLSFPLGYSAYLSALVCLVPVLFVSVIMEPRTEVPPPRPLFDQFPMKIGGWEGKTSVLEPMYVDFLRFDDYLLADYRQGNAAPINLYVAYYQSQRKGESAHSPRTCIPGGGWEISSIRSIDVGDPSRAEPHLPVNRVIIQKNDEKQLVFYWFQQRGRLLTNEYSVKYYLFWDAATRNRTDGALVRMTSPVLAGESESKAEARLAAFTQEVYPTLTRFIPGG